MHKLNFLYIERKLSNIFQSYLQDRPVLPPLQQQELHPTLSEPSHRRGSGSSPLPCASIQYLEDIKWKRFDMFDNIFYRLTIYTVSFYK